MGMALSFFSDPKNQDGIHIEWKFLSEMIFSQTLF